MGTVNRMYHFLMSQRVLYKFDHHWMKRASSKIGEKLMFVGSQKTSLCSKWPKESVTHWRCRRRWWADIRAKTRECMSCLVVHSLLGGPSR